MSLKRITIVVREGCVRLNCPRNLTCYARAVVAGEVLASRWVKLACQGHLDDVASSVNPEYPYRFSAKKVKKVCKFAEMLPLGGG